MIPFLDISTAVATLSYEGKKGLRFDIAHFLYRMGYAIILTHSFGFANDNYDDGGMRQP